VEFGEEVGKSDTAKKPHFKPHKATINPAKADTKAGQNKDLKRPSKIYGLD
jgi:hypothetical protein